MKAILLLLLGACTFLSGQAKSPSTSSEPMKTHIAYIKKAVVQILINGSPAGSGFLASADGLVVTCFHVAQRATPDPANPAMTQLNYQPNISVKLPNGLTLPAQPHSSCLNAGFMTALTRDFVILKIAGTNYDFLKLGDYATVSEGDSVISCGFPLGIAQSIAAAGIVSSKWDAPNNLNQAGMRKAAWVDVTMNKGNSGGPVIVLGATPEDARVIGIATFILSPFASDAERLHVAATSAGANINMGGISIQDFARLTGAALSTMSLGISACVSIEYCKAALPP